QGLLEELVLAVVHLAQLDHLVAQAVDGRGAQRVVVAVPGGGLGAGRALQEVVAHEARSSAPPACRGHVPGPAGRAHWCQAERGAASRVGAGSSRAQGSSGICASRWSNAPTAGNSSGTAGTTRAARTASASG